MADLTTKKRDALRSTTFGLPDRRAYPMPDRAHAANAKARASQEFNAGKLSAHEKATIDAKANRILNEGQSAKPRNS